MLCSFVYLKVTNEQFIRCTSICQAVQLDKAHSQTLPLATWSSGLDEHRGAALFQDGQTYRGEYSCRSQRVWPGIGSKLGKKIGKNALSDPAGLSRCLLSGDLFRLESAPFQSKVSRYYYVIALRHILC